MSDVTLGTCKLMCPQTEIQFRIEHKLVHILEFSCSPNGGKPQPDPRKMVKEFSRSAAGNNLLISGQLRPLPVLLECIDYLLELFLTKKGESLEIVYNFVMDRLRSVRQDMVIQQLNAHDTKIMDEVHMVSDLSWVARGIPKKIPDKIKLDEEQLKQLIHGGEEECEEDDHEETNMELEDKNETASDEEKNEHTAMKGIAMYASNKDDPYITEHIDSDAEDEKEEFEVRPDDNMVAVAKIRKDDYNLEVYVYNQADDDWYCHHDYILDAPPLCLETVQYDPGNNETGKGNLLAVGTMNSCIGMWDLDIVNSAEPVVTLGANQKPGKRKKRDGSAQGHSDAVLCLAWNKLTEHVIASGGADKQVILWDIDEAKAAQIIGNRGAEVQGIKWHPVESTYILIGTMAGDVQVVDCREANGETSAEWKFNGQVEKLQWNYFNPFTAFIATNDGYLRHIDMRKPGECIWEGKVHDESIGGLSLSAITRGLLVTAGHDEILNVWKVLDSGAIDHIYSEKLALGPLHALQFNPDVATILCVGGSSNDLTRVLDLAKIDSVSQAFS